MTEWAKASEASVPQSRYDEICEEVWDLLHVEHWTQILHVAEGENADPLNAKLQELLDNIEKQSSMELSAWLRYSFSRKAYLPAWSSLRDATIAQAFARNSEEWVTQNFVGLFPKDDED